MTSQHAYGWHPSVPDIRDHPMLVHALAPGQMPTSYDLRAQMPPVGDQGQLGSCTAWASTAAYRYEMDKQKLADFEPSELAQYYWSRQLEGNVKSDAGATIRDAIKVLGTVGAAPEALWPYKIEDFAKAPPASVKAGAKKHLAVSYESVPQDLNQIKTALVADFPVVIGISVYASFESAAVAKTGVVPMPSRKEKLLGGHAVCIVGYDDFRSCFIVRNSWSDGWGDKGYFYLPYAYVTNAQLASDFWIVKSIAA